MDRVQYQEPYRIKVFARDSAGAGVTGASITLAIRRDSNGYWWNGTSFQSGYTTVSMSETDSSNLAGVYHYDFIALETDFTAIFYATTATAAVVNDPFVGDLFVGYWVDNLDTANSTLATGSDVDVLKARLGSVVMDNELFRLRALLGQIQDSQRQMVRVLDELKRK